MPDESTSPAPAETSGPAEAPSPASRPDRTRSLKPQVSPDTSYEAIAKRAPGRDLTDEEFETLVDPYLLAPDGEA